MGTVKASLKNQEHVCSRNSSSWSRYPGCPSGVRHNHCCNSSNPLIAISCVFDPISKGWLPEVVSAQVLVSAQGGVHNHLRKYILIEFQNQQPYFGKISQSFPFTGECGEKSDRCGMPH